MKKLRQLILFLGDLIMAAGALLATVYLGFWNNFSWRVFNQHILPFSILYAVWLAIFYVFGLYDLSVLKPKTDLLSKIGQGFAVCFLIGLAFFYLIPIFGITPKTNLLIDILVFAGLVLLWRRAFYGLFSTVYLRNIGFLGKTALSENLYQTIKNNPQLGYKLAGYLEKTENIIHQIKQNKIQVLVLSQDISKNPKIVQGLYQCLPLRIDILDLARAYEAILQKIPIDFVNQTWFLQNLSEGEKISYDKTKRIIDVFLAGLLLAITSPFWFFIFLAIKLDDKGAIFYKQQRIGKDNRVFWIWKFRSMKPDAEKTGAKWAEKNDPRITKAGKILRRLHFDEFPQMLNVLKGDISLVGPRPERPEFVRQLTKQIPHYHLRNLIKPGFTGWAQVKYIHYARNEQESHEKFQYDLYYIKNRSFFLDLGILLKTFQLFFTKG
ncbi:MAG: sugar transferase [Patescibacteria group bacterium]|nr:sugar transferase [Patescibacteria group bacterium]